MMKFASKFTRLTECDQRIEGVVDGDGAKLVISEELEKNRAPTTLYFTSKEEIAALVDMLVAMDKAMVDL